MDKIKKHVTLKNAYKCDFGKLNYLINWEVALGLSSIILETYSLGYHLKINSITHTSIRNYIFNFI